MEYRTDDICYGPYHSEPTDVPYSPNQFLGWDFFADSYSETVLDTKAALLYRVTKKIN